VSHITRRKYDAGVVGAEAGSPLAERVAGSAWYQSMVLPGGIVTPGNFDTSDELARLPFPTSLAGKRCLDVGTADGFWAFEMERRGAQEVVAIDLRDPARLDWPGVARSDEEMRAVLGPEVARHHGFDIAHQALGSRVQWQELAVYDLRPELVGEFDFAFMGSLLLHLRDPVAALAAVAGVVRGHLLSVDAVSPLLTLMHPQQPIARFEAPGWPMWWALNLAAYRRLFPASGMQVEACGRPFFLKPGPGYGSAPRSRRPLLRHLQPLLIRHRGILHAWVVARREPR
jgi:tRNA (mo5U34)-methyltransferase